MNRQASNVIGGLVVWGAIFLFVGLLFWFMYKSHKGVQALTPAEIAALPACVKQQIAASTFGRTWLQRDIVPAEHLCESEALAAVQRNAARAP